MIQKALAEELRGVDGVDIVDIGAKAFDKITGQNYISQISGHLKAKN